jgi:integrase
MDPKMTLKQFSRCKLEGILDRIRGQVQRSDGKPAKEAHKQARAAVFISFTEFIARQYVGDFRRVLLNKYSGNKTFAYKRHESSATILTDQQLLAFFTVLKRNNFKAYLFALIQFHGARRVAEVARIRIQDVCWSSESIFFSPSKTGKVAKKRIAIRFPSDFMTCLKSFISKIHKPTRSSDFLFTHSDNPIKTCTITSYYRSAWWLAEPGWLPDSITHCIRATMIALNLRLGKSFEEILRVTGHSDYRMVGYYGERGQISNITSSLMALRIFNVLFSL